MKKFKVFKLIKKQQILINYRMKYEVFNPLLF
jgi:hypothetical protein